MKRYNFQDLILSEETDVEYYQCSDVDWEIKRAYDYLSMCGVPKQRAGTLHNGIDVLATRFRKEINMDAGEKGMLQEKIKKLQDVIKQIARGDGELYASDARIMRNIAKDVLEEIE